MFHSNLQRVRWDGKVYSTARLLASLRRSGFRRGIQPPVPARAFPFQSVALERVTAPGTLLRTVRFITTICPIGRCVFKSIQSPKGSGLTQNRAERKCVKRLQKAPARCGQRLLRNRA